MALLVLKVGYEFAFSSYDQAKAHPNSFVVYYRPQCPRCRKVMPHVVGLSIFSLKRDYFIDVNHLSNEDENDLRRKLSLLPGFSYRGGMHETISKKQITVIWEKSH